MVPSVAWHQELVQKIPVHGSSWQHVLMCPRAKHRFPCTLDRTEETVAACTGDETVTDGLLFNVRNSRERSKPGGLTQSRPSSVWRWVQRCQIGLDFPLNLATLFAARWSADIWPNLATLVWLPTMPVK
jgi:hypothetical protein